MQTFLCVFKYVENVGGGEGFTRILTRRFVSLGNTVTLVTNKPQVFADLIPHHISVRFFAWGQEVGSRTRALIFVLLAPYLYIRFFFLLRSLNHGSTRRIVIFQNFNEKILASALARKLGFEVYWVEHVALGDWLQKNWLRAFYCRASRSANTIITVADFINKQVRDLGVPQERVKTIHNGIEAIDQLSQAQAEELKSELGIYTTGMLIGSVGRLDPEKGFDVLLRSFARVINTINDAKLLIVGDGPARNNLEQLSRELGLQDKVIFAGYRPDAQQIIFLLDIFVLPSALREACSLVLLEAMAAQKPLIASNVGGNPEIVRDGINGYIFPAQDDVALSRLLQGLAADQQQKEVFAKNNRALFKAEFNVDVMIDKYRKALSL